MIISAEVIFCFTKSQGEPTVGLSFDSGE